MVLATDAGHPYETLVCEQGREPAYDLLKRVKDVVSGAKDHQADRAALAGLWLWHDFLDKSHTISQAIETPEGSWWHAIMHRREGDFSNAKYWYRRVGQHALMEQIAVEAGGEWEPMAFVDQCEQAHRSGKGVEEAVALQKLEWRALFRWCVELARG